MLSCGDRDYATIPLVSFIVLLLIIAVSITISFIYNERKAFKQPENKKSLWICALVTAFCFDTILFLSIKIPYLTHSCDIYQSIWSGIWIIAYDLQFYFLLIVWILRLYYILQNTSNPISERVVYCCLTFYTSLLSKVILDIFYVTKAITSETYSSAAAIPLLLSIILLIVNVVLFATKLVRLYRLVEDKNDLTIPCGEESLKSVATRIIILSFVSLFITFITMISIVIRLNFDGIFVEFISHLIIIVDVFSNFICVMVCF